jgi:plasmid stability protein
VWYACIACIACIVNMATLTIRNLDEDLKTQLRIEAASHGHSMEEEVRLILRRALSPRRMQPGLGRRVHRRFSALGGLTLDLPSRTDRPRGVDFSE